jgi:signal transduction histidine kinase
MAMRKGDMGRSFEVQQHTGRSSEWDATKLVGRAKPRLRDAGEGRWVSRMTDEALPQAPSDLPCCTELERRVLALEEQNRSLEDQIRQLHRVKTVVDLLAGIAHDLSSAVTGMLWCCEAIKTRVATHDPELLTGVGDLVHAADYTRKLARRLIAIGRSGDGEPSPCPVCSVMEEAGALAQALCPHGVTLQLELSAKNAWVHGSAEQLQQVLVNLTTNAFDALRGSGGRVIVSLTRRDRGRCDDDGTPSAEVVLRVQDDGPGMSPETLARAFEPFFTTKGAREGNGLGLSVVRGIVERHGGTVRAESRPGVGTTMIVTLPLCPPPPAP